MSTLNLTANPDNSSPMRQLRRSQTSLPRHPRNRNTHRRQQSNNEASLSEIKEEDSNLPKARAIEKKPLDLEIKEEGNKPPGVLETRLGRLSCESATVNLGDDQYSAFASILLENSPPESHRLLYTDPELSMSELDRTQRIVLLR